jgi:DNA-binding SARP family transcriptional activator/tetratricopeptide (TPR) repeat protein
VTLIPVRKKQYNEENACNFSPQHNRSEMKRLSLTLLGAFQVALDEKPALGFESNKVRALLAYLAVEADQLHRRELLAELFWPDRSEGVARKNLNQALTNLRKTIGDREGVPSFLRVTRDELRFNPESDYLLDVNKFTNLLTICKEHRHRRISTCKPCIQRLEKVVGLYMGEFLGGFTLIDCPTFEEWALIKREGLRRQMTDALKHLASYHERRGEYEVSREFSRRQVELEPWDEEAQRALMRNLALDGMRIAALNQYHDWRSVLADELGIEPTPETTALYEQIRSGELSTLDPHSILPSLHQRHNLPHQSTSFIGRESELREIEDQLENPDCRLLTLVGPGGIGKSRLALEVAFENIGGYDHGVYFIPLAGLGSPEFLVPTVVDGISLTLSGDADPKTQLLDYLREKEMLLVLDNFDYLMEGAGLLAEIMTTATRVNLLVTSRESLPLRAETTYEVRELHYPIGDLKKIGNLVNYSAVKLFLERARLVQPSFSADAKAIKEVVRICQFAGGLPLGIELAAAWMDTLSLAALNIVIQKGLNILETEWLDVPERHRSMRAVFDTSWRQLNKPMRETFSQLSIFRGGFTLAAAQNVTDAQKSSPNFLRLLAGLVSKSLLRFNSEHERYEIHELLRQFGADKLTQFPAEESMIRDRHSAYYCDLLQNHQTNIQYTPMQQVLAELENDSENIHTAWRWAVTQMQLERLAQSIDSLCYFFRWRGHYQDGEKATKLIVDSLTVDKLAARHSVDSLRLLTKSLAWQGHFCILMGRTEEAEQILQECSATLDSPRLADQDTQSERVFLLGQRGLLAEISGHLEESKQWIEQRLALYRAMGDQLGMANTLVALGWVDWSLGNFHEAKQQYEEGLALYQAQGHQWGIAEVLRGLGRVARALLDYKKASYLFEESLALSQDEGNQRGITDALDQLGFLASFQGRFEEGESLLQQSLDISREIGDRVKIGFGFLQLGGALWLSGEHTQGYSYMEESMTIFNDLEDAVLISHATQFLATTNVYLGRYEKAHAQAKMLTTQEGSYPYLLGTAQRALGWVALVEEKFTHAHHLMQESVATFRDIEERERIAWSLAALGRTSYALGNRSEAQQQLYEALELATKIGAFIPLLYIIPIVAYLLADQGEVERGIELYSMASQHPFVREGQLFEDIAGRQIVDLAASLPSDVVEAARARGKAREMWDTASELLKELPKLGWSKPID